MIMAPGTPTAIHLGKGNIHMSHVADVLHGEHVGGRSRQAWPCRR